MTNEVDLIAKSYSTMAPTPKKQRLLDHLHRQWLSRRRYRLLNWLLLGGDLFDPSIILTESKLKLNCEVLSVTRYYDKPRDYYRRLDSNSRLESFLEEPTKEKPKVYFNEEEFRNEYGMSRNSFWTLHNIIPKFMKN